MGRERRDLACFASAASGETVRAACGWVSGILVSPPLRADAEMVVNSENKPLPVKGFAAPHRLRSEGRKPLPPGARRWVWG